LPVPTGLPRSLWEANRIDAYAARRIENFRIEQGHSNEFVRINKRIDVPGGGHRRPDIYFPQTGNWIDGTVGFKSATTPQVRDIFRATNQGDGVIVRPANRNGSYVIQGLR
jgi:hypothetical protein